MYREMGAKYLQAQKAQSRSKREDLKRDGVGDNGPREGLSEDMTLGQTWIQ